MGEVILLCGRIASGKTTYAKALCQDGAGILLSCDELMLILFDSCLGERHNEIQDRCADYLFSVACQVVSAGKLAVLDFGFWTKESRERAMAYFKDRGISVSLRVLTCPDELRLPRLEERNRLLTKSPRREYIITPEMLARFDRVFEEPGPEEEFEPIWMGE